MQEPVDNSWLVKLGEYAGAIGGVLAVAASVWAYLKLVRGKGRIFLAWCRNAVNTPTAVAKILTELQFENGMTLRDRLLVIDDNMSGLRRMIQFETASRRAILQTVPMAMFEADKDGRFLWANTVFLDTADCSLSEIAGNNWRNIIAGPDREEVFDGWMDAVRDGTDFKAKFRLATDASEQWVRFHAICNKDELGNILGYGGKIVEIADPRIH